MNRAECKLCGQPLRDKAAVAAVRSRNTHARKLSGAQRSKLRRLLVTRVLKQHETDNDRVPGWSMETIAAKVGCNRRTAIRELEWLEADGTLAAALEKAGHKS